MYSGQSCTVKDYDRKIKYLDYVENGLRSKGAGFVKLERRDGVCNISLQISGLYRKDHFVRPLVLLGKDGEHELCRLQLADGGIKTYLEGLDSHNLDGQGLDYEQLAGLRIPVSEGKEIRCLWDKEEVKNSERTAAKPMEEKRTEQPTEAIPMEEKRTEQPAPPTEPVLLEDKWEQLSAIYPHICPFSDEREYLSLGPQDFVILRGQYYKLVSNSFLLHGYYNYNHLILTGVTRRNNVRYYIGVPGVYYEREKKIAILFGFESFECAVEPAKEGDFGYYMIPVEL